MLLTIQGTKWPILCWCAIKKLLIHLLTVSQKKNVSLFIFVISYSNIIQICQFLAESYIREFEIKAYTQPPHLIASFYKVTVQTY